MEAISITEALSLTSGTYCYQNKLFCCLAISCFAFSNFLFNLPLLLLDNQSGQNVTNYFLLFEDDYVIRIYLKLSFLAGIPIGGLVLSYTSDKFGRQSVLKNLLRWEIVFLVFCGISFTPNYFMMNCFFLGFIVFTGISGCFLYLFESMDYQKITFYNAGLIFSIFLSLFLASIVNFYGVNWRLIIMGNVVVAGLGLFLTKGTLESVEWLESTSRKEEAERVLTKIAEINGKIENIELFESTHNCDKRIFSLRFLCLPILWINFFVLGWVFNQLVENIFWDIYWEKSVLACAGAMLSVILGFCISFNSCLRLWPLQLATLRGFFVLMYFVSDPLLKIFLIICTTGLLVFELINLIIVTKIELKASFGHSGFALLNLVSGITSILICRSINLHQEPISFYISMLLLFISPILPACYLKQFYHHSLYTSLSQESQPRD